MYAVYIGQDKQENELFLTSDFKETIYLDEAWKGYTVQDADLMAKKYRQKHSTFMMAKTFEIVR